MDQQEPKAEEPWNSDFEDEVLLQIQKKEDEKEKAKEPSPYADEDWEEEDVPAKKIQLLKISW